MSRSTKKDLITGKICVKYHSSGTHCSKVISKGKVFKKQVKLNYNAIAFTIQMLLARSKIQTELQNYGMTNRTKTICPMIFDLGGIK